MPLIPTPIGLGLFFTAFVGTRVAQERALRKLDTESKGRLVEAFSGLRLIALLPLAAIAAIYFALSSFGSSAASTMLAIYLPTTLVFVVVLSAITHKKLRALSLDPEYLRVYSICRIISLAAFAVLLLAI